MAPACSLNRGERYSRITLGAGFVAAGFLLHRDTFSAVTLVVAGSAITGAASLGH
jgi:hypothetical protein